MKKSMNHLKIPNYPSDRPRYEDGAAGPSAVAYDDADDSDMSLSPERPQEFDPYSSGQFAPLPQAPLRPHPSNFSRPSVAANHMPQPDPYFHGTRNPGYHSTNNVPQEGDPRPAHPASSSGAPKLDGIDTDAITNNVLSRILASQLVKELAESGSHKRHIEYGNVSSSSSKRPMRDGNRYSNERRRPEDFNADDFVRESSEDRDRRLQKSEYDRNLNRKEVGYDRFEKREECHHDNSEIRRNNSRYEREQDRSYDRRERRYENSYDRSERRRENSYDRSEKRRESSYDRDERRYENSYDRSERRYESSYDRSERRRESSYDRDERRRDSNFDRDERRQVTLSEREYSREDANSIGREEEMINARGERELHEPSGEQHIRFQRRDLQEVIFLEDRYQRSSDNSGYDERIREYQAGRFNDRHLQDSELPSRDRIVTVVPGNTGVRIVRQCTNNPNNE